ncbi:MAG TPA: hypothetical protein VEU52_07550 [Candidatus Limnocylindrales bacterium]|nr:hypothetical protein [Candidatus Limnocylindrales bacterium]
MGKYDVSLKAASKSVQRALKKLRAIRPSVTKDDQTKIDLEIRDLNKVAALIRPVCHIRGFHRAPSRKRK